MERIRLFLINHSKMNAKSNYEMMAQDLFQNNQYKKSHNVLF